MILFWLIAAAMLIVTLAILLSSLLDFDLWRRLGLSKPKLGEHQKELRALQARFAAGEIDEASFSSEKARIADALIEAVSPHEQSGESLKTTGAGVKISAVIIGVLVPVLCVYLYVEMGTLAALNPQALTPVAPPNTEQAPGTVEEMVASLAARLKDNPDDADGWVMLGRSYFVMERYAQSKDAYTRAYQLLGDDPDIMVDLAEVSALAAENRLEGQPEQLINKALAVQPQNQKGLWLAGFAHLQRGENAEAIARWETLNELLPPGSEQIAVIEQMIARAGGSASVTQAEPAATQPTDERPPTESDASGPEIIVSVSLDPELLGRITGNETLFVFAKAVNGPPMPLAIQRTTANALPITIRLDNTMGMLPAFKLSSFAQVTVGARISLSGIATAQSGDLQGEVSPIAVDGTQETAVVISEVVP